jgi:NitT/TauT family transport system ATP-binding protein
MSTLELKNVKKTFPNPDSAGNFTVLDNIDIMVEEESFTTIMGPSGCGKSTILNIIAGILPMDSGEIRLDNRPVEAGEYSFGYVFQDPRLLNWRTVEQNLRIIMDAHDMPEDKQTDRIREWLDKVGLAGEEHNYPLRLSGGMRQRVGLCRAMVIDPDILLMDEPFSALDEVTARTLREDLIDIWQNNPKEILYVTHDIDEAVTLSDRILFMNSRGQIFKRATIDIQRPRGINQPEVVETRAELEDQFFEEIYQEV